MTAVFPSYRALFIRAVQGAAVGTEDGPGLPSDVTLYQSVPNPVGSGTTIRYALPEPAPVNVRVYDVTGRLVHTLVDADLQAGFHEVAWDTNGLPGGVYIVMLETGTVSRSVRVSLVR
jgi:hypothetical protein